MEFSPNLLKVLSCPVSGDKLIYNKIDNELVSEKAGLAYPVIDGIPILLKDKARKITITNIREQISNEELEKSEKSQSYRVA